MKKLIFLVAMMILGVTSLSAQERAIDENMLPSSAKNFLSTYYPTEKVSIATLESSMMEKDYKVILTSGVKVEFDKAGVWSSVECKGRSYVPFEAVPQPIAQYVKGRFPDNKIVKIERDKRETEVELDNDIELKFNSKGEFITFDN